MTIPIITNLPASTQPRSEFNTKVDGLWPQLNTSITEMNRDITSVNSNSISASLASTQAQAASANATAIANYRGLWSSLTGALAIPASVFHNERFWALKSNAANVALIEPSVSTQWVALETGSEPFTQVKHSFLADFANTEAVDPRFTVTRASTATCIGKRGFRITVPANQPRIHYDAFTGKCKGLLGEQATTNTALHSNDFTNAAWVKSNCTVTANNALGADNTLSASTLAFAGGVSGGIRQDITASGTSSQTFSKDIASADCNILAMTINWLGSVTQEVIIRFNAITGAFISASNLGATLEGWTIQPLKNGLFRVSISGTGTNASNNTVRFNLFEEVASACSVVASSAQFEALPYPTSYTGHTTTSAITRANESLVIDSTGFSNIFNPIEGTILCKHSHEVSMNTSLNNSVLSINDNTANNQILLRAYLNNGGNFADALITTGGVIQSDFTEIDIGVGNTVTHALSYKANDIAYARNGNSLQLDNTATLPTVTRMVLGGSTPCSIERVALYPVRISNNELLSLTRN
jgi:hypothetical protein